MPEPAVLSKFVGRPEQAAEIEEAGADDDASGAVSPSENEGAYGHCDSAYQRIEQKHFLLVGAKIVGLGGDDDIHDHIKQQNSQ